MAYFGLLLLQIHLQKQQKTTNNPAATPTAMRIASVRSNLPISDCGSKSSMKGSPVPVNTGTGNVVLTPSGSVGEGVVVIISGSVNISIHHLH